MLGVKRLRLHRVKRSWLDCNSSDRLLTEWQRLDNKLICYCPGQAHRGLRGWKRVLVEINWLSAIQIVLLLCWSWF